MADFEPYPDRIGIVKFKDGTFQVDDRSPDVPPNVVYIQAELSPYAKPDQRINRIANSLIGCTIEEMESIFQSILEASKQVIAEREALNS